MGQCVLYLGNYPWYNIFCSLLEILKCSDRPKAIYYQEMPKNKTHPGQDYCGHGQQDGDKEPIHHKEQLSSHRTQPCKTWLSWWQKSLMKPLSSSRGWKICFGLGERPRSSGVPSISTYNHLVVCNIMTLIFFLIFILNIIRSCWCCCFSILLIDISQIYILFLLCDPLPA